MMKEPDKPVIVIVAGGLATRMQPFTQTIPKCLIPLGDRPLIEHQLLEFKRQGYTNIIFCVAHLAEQVKAYFGNGEKIGMHIDYSAEPEQLLGTAGSVGLLRKKIDDTFIVFYGDVLTPLQLDDALAQHNRHHAACTVVVRDLPKGYKSSSLIRTDAQFMITSFIEKPTPEDFANSTNAYINNGIYIIEPSVFEYILEGKKVDFAKDVFPKLLVNKERMQAFVCNDFREFGRLEKYLRFRVAWKGKDIMHMTKKRKAIFLDRDGVINKNAENITSPEQFELLPGVVEAIKRINESDYFAIIVTNQPIIAKGFMTFSDLDRVHKKMTDALAAEGAYIDAIYVCPHHPEKGFFGEIPELKMDCDCRKPKPGLILQAKKDDPYLDLSESWMIGDSPSDIAAGKAAGCKTILTSGEGLGSKHELNINAAPDCAVATLSEALMRLL
ncbi:MAG: HAD-IIIA family hydrolase [archaeon]